MSEESAANFSDANFSDAELDEILNLVENCHFPGGKYRAAVLVRKIPKLVIEIKELRKRLVTLDKLGDEYIKVLTNSENDHD